MKGEGGTPISLAATEFEMKSLSPLLALGKKEKRDYRPFFSFILQKMCHSWGCRKECALVFRSIFQKRIPKGLGKIVRSSTSVCPRWDSFGRAFFIVWSTTVKRRQQTSLQVYLHTSHFPAPWNNLPRGASSVAPCLLVTSSVVD